MMNWTLNRRKMISNDLKLRYNKIFVCFHNYLREVGQLFIQRDSVI